MSVCVRGAVSSRHRGGHSVAPSPRANRPRPEKVRIRRVTATWRPSLTRMYRRVHGQVLMVACFGEQPQAAAWHQLGRGGGARDVRGCTRVRLGIPAVPVLRRSGENYGTM